MEARGEGRWKALGKRALAILFWLLAWQALSAAVDQQILLVSPLSALTTLARLMGSADFYRAVALSFGRILLGFSLAVAAGVILGILAARFSLIRALLGPLMAAIKATPVASFVILALVWISARNLSVFTGFLMVLPVIYLNVVQGLQSADEKLLQMARAFDLGLGRRARAIYLPALFPYFLTGCQLSLGICWKAGIAAEVIGQPAGSIGDKLYRAKLFLSTDELFAWTVAVVLLSVALEKAVLCLIGRLQRLYGGGEAA